MIFTLINGINYFIERKIIPGFKTKKSDLVIDIGSGDKPFWRANVFLDNLKLKNLHRHTDSETNITFGKFIDGDITKTKFKNKIFDFSFCSHLLEHVERPDLAIKEIMRISKRGYLEVPNGIIEFISPFHSHIWFIIRSNNKLIFIRKSEYLHKNLLLNSIKFKGVIQNMHDPFIRLYWKDKIEFEIVDLNKNIKKYLPPKNTPKTEKNPTFLKLSTLFYLFSTKLLRNFYKVNDNIDLKNLMMK